MAKKFNNPITDIAFYHTLYTYMAELHSDISDFKQKGKMRISPKRISLCIYPSGHPLRLGLAGSSVTICRAELVPHCIGN